MAIDITAKAVVDSDVFVISADEFSAADLSAPNSGDPPPSVNGRPITALAPHPDLNDLIFVTTGPPDSLSFLPDPYIELE